MNQFHLTQADYESRWNSWASAASEYCQRGYPVHYEGVDWQQACQDHGLYGAIDKVKAAYRLRQHQRRLPS
jgi:hypothetical protein